MSNLEIQRVESNRDRRRFFNLPWQLYRDDPNWIPPLRTNQKEMLGYHPHPFYHENQIQTFLALRDGQPCGRVAAIVNHAHMRRYDERLGFFGFFESIDDREVSTALFDTVRDWLAERGIRRFRGPMNPSLNYESGLLIDGFTTPPTFMLTYNPPYYEGLVEDYGFHKSQDMYSYWGHVDMLDQMDEKLHFVFREAKRRFRVETRRMDRSRYDQEVRLFLSVFNRSFEGTWGFVPWTEGEIEHMSASLKHLIVPEMTTIGEIDGQPIGVVLGLLDYNPRIKQINGRLFPFGFMRLFWNRRAIKQIRIMSANVVPEYQRWGLGLVLLERLGEEVRAWGINDAEFSWVLESNQLSRASLERGGAVRQKTHRIYDYAAAEGPSAENGALA